ncbi:MAG: hypothetical protein ACE5EG_12350, partial [Thermoanaerobaculia bacterium]
MAVQPEDVRLLANDRFRRLVESRAVGQIAQNAMLYTLLILVVNETGSSIHSTLLVAAWIIPSIVLGIPAGGLADILPRRPLLVLGTLLVGLGVQAFSIGLVGELILFFHARGVRGYRITAVYESDPA